MTTKSSNHDSAPWWNEFFDDSYAAYGFSISDPEVLNQTVDFIIRTLELSPDDLLFDQCCGVGRLSLPIAERSIRVIGVAQGATYIDKAKSKAKERNLPCLFHCGDAFEFVSPEPCDAAINWFTSFGYCEDDGENIKMLQRVYESLNPGGRFMLDFKNVPRILSDFQHAIVSQPENEEAKGIVVIQKNTVNFLRGMMESVWTEIDSTGRRRVNEIETRLFVPHEIINLMRHSGFTDFQLYGWRDGSPLSLTSPRCIVFGRKPTM